MNSAPEGILQSLSSFSFSAPMTRLVAFVMATAITVGIGWQAQFKERNLAKAHINALPAASAHDLSMVGERYLNFRATLKPGSAYEIRDVAPVNSGTNFTVVVALPKSGNGESLMSMARELSVRFHAPDGKFDVASLDAPKLASQLIELEWPKTLSGHKK